MSVKHSKARRLANGNVVVTMELSVRDWSTFETAAAHRGYASAADYLAGLVNMQLIEDEVDLNLWMFEDGPDDKDADPDPYGDGIPF